MNDDAGREQAGIELGIDAHQRAGRAQHGGHMVKQTAPLRVMHLLGGGKGEKPVPCAVEQLAGDPAQIVVGNVVGGTDHLREHFPGILRRTGDQSGHIHLIALFNGADLFNAQLHAAVEFIARGAHFDNASRDGRLHGAIPHFGVDGSPNGRRGSYPDSFFRKQAARCSAERTIRYPSKRSSRRISARNMVCSPFFRVKRRKDAL